MGSAEQRERPEGRQVRKVAIGEGRGAAGASSERVEGEHGDGETPDGRQKGLGHGTETVGGQRDGESPG